MTCIRLSWKSTPVLFGSAPSNGCSAGFQQQDEGRGGGNLCTNSPPWSSRRTGPSSAPEDDEGRKEGRQPPNVEFVLHCMRNMQRDAPQRWSTSTRASANAFLTPVLQIPHDMCAIRGQSFRGSDHPKVQAFTTMPSMKAYGMFCDNRQSAGLRCGARQRCSGAGECGVPDETAGPEHRPPPFQLRRPL